MPAGGEPHDEIDGEEGNHRDEPQREEVEGAVFCHPGIDGGEPLPKCR